MMTKSELLIELTGRALQGIIASESDIYRYKDLYRDPEGHLTRVPCGNTLVSTRQEQIAAEAVKLAAATVKSLEYHIAI